MPIRLLQDSSAATRVSLLGVGQEFDSWRRHFYGITAFLILDWLRGPGTRNSPRLLNLVLEHLGWIILWGSAREGGGPRAHCRMPGCIPDLNPLDAFSTHSLCRDN